MNQYRVGNVKKLLTNWQRITNNEEIFKNIKGAKILLSMIPNKKYNQNPSFTTAESTTIDEGISKLLKKEVTKPLLHEQGEYISPNIVIKKMNPSSSFYYKNWGNIFPLFMK